jgi:hypothetical protein
MNLHAAFMLLPSLCPKSRAREAEEEIRDMKGWVLAAGLLAAAASGQAMAADLGDVPPDRYGGSPYDDPRYADIYKYPDKYQDGRRYYGQPYGQPPIPRAPVYGGRYDDRYYEEGDRYAYKDQRFPRQGQCVPREHIKYQLKEQGWHDFQDLELRREVATLIARRPSGRPFELTIDRCSGAIVSMRRLERHPYGPYADRGQWQGRRWERY